MPEKRSAILLVHCPDRMGIVASVTDFIYQNGGNIIDLDQHVDRENEKFFMRVEWSLDSFNIDENELEVVFKSEIADKFNMDWSIKYSDRKDRMAVFVSKIPHCLYDILARTHFGEWNVEIPLIVSNHPDLKHLADAFGIDYHVFPNVKSDKSGVEAKQLELLDKYNIDFVVLARYMQILTEGFTSQFPSRIINIHHSFLPAFPGAKPYHSAFERGVKIIGATSHYATAELDAGPIIEQDIVRVSHNDSVDDLIRKGRDLEKVVLSRAIRAHIDRNILVYNNKTVVFNG